jgi:hypothetical protein
MTEPCEHCHYHEPEGDHLFLKILTMLVLAGMVWTIYQELEDLNARMKKLENPPLPPRARAKLEKVEDE